MAWPAGLVAVSAAARASSDNGQPGGQPELLADDVEPRHQLGHPVLHLQPRVHLEEVERPVGGPQELGGRGVAQPGGGRHPDGQVVESPAIVAGQPRRRCLLDELLVATLERAVALPDGDDAPRVVAQQLDLDVPGRHDLPLQVDRAVAERRRRLV